MSDEELRAAYEAELKRVTIGDVLIQTTVSIINLTGRKLGLTEDTRDERDLEQARDGIDAARALLPVVERRGDINLGPLRDALSQLQLAYAQEAGAGGAPGSAGAPSGGAGGAAGSGKAGDEEAGGEGSAAGEDKTAQPGPAQSSGRLWIPGQ